MTENHLPKDKRAEELFAQLEDRYRDFASRLPSPLSLLAGLKNTYSGQLDQQPFEGIATLNPVLAATPWLFWGLFKDLGDDSFLNIAEAGMYFVLASVVLDHLIDGQGLDPRGLSLLHQALYHKAVSIFQGELGEFPAFWSHFNRLSRKHLEGLSAELEIQKTPKRLHIHDLFTMAHGKVSPIVNTSAALAFVSGQPDLLDPIENSLNHISVASQLLDDIGDWQEDLSTHHMTYFLGQCAPSEVWALEGWLERDGAQDYIKENWLDVTNMNLVVEWLDLAVGAVEGICCPGWIRYVDGYRQRADRHLTNFYLGYIGKALNIRTLDGKEGGGENH